MCLLLGDLAMGGLLSFHWSIGKNDGSYTGGPGVSPEGESGEQGIVMEAVDHARRGRKVVTGKEKETPKYAREGNYSFLTSNRKC